MADDEVKKNKYEATLDQDKIWEHVIQGQEKQLQDLLKELDNNTVKASSLIGVLSVIIALLFNKDVAIDKGYVIIALFFLLIGILLCVWMFIPQLVNAHLNYGAGPNYNNYLDYLKERYISLLKTYNNVSAFNEKRDELIKFAAISSFVAIIILSIGFILTNNNDSKNSSDSKEKLLIHSCWKQSYTHSWRN